MQAVILDAFGDVSNFRLAETPKPQAGPGQVLIRVKAASVNPVDTKIRRHGPFFAPKLPAILGMDAAGVVEEIGQGVEGFKPGDEVYGCAGGAGDLPGSLAQYMAADARLVAKKPAALSMRQAAALPLVTITAWKALHDRAGLKSGQHVLVHAGTGGVGHVGVQLAKAFGARVATTVSSQEKAELAASLGADEIADYRAETVEEYVKRLTDGRGFDVVFDTVGGPNLDASFKAARLEGVVVSTATRESHDLTIVHEKGLSLHVVFMLLPMIHGFGRERHGEILRQAARLVDEGRLKPLLDSRTFTLKEAGAAHSYLESGQAVGKVVVDVD